MMPCPDCGTEYVIFGLGAVHKFNCPQYVELRDLRLQIEELRADRDALRVSCELSVRKEVLEEAAQVAENFSARSDDYLARQCIRIANAIRAKKEE